MSENIKAKFKNLGGRIIEVYRYYYEKRFTTGSGTLVYFFLMSLAPFLFRLA